MITYPSVKDLMEKMNEGDSRYTLVIATAKRARQITNGYTAFATAESGKPVSIAAQEIKDGSITYFNDNNRPADVADFGEDAMEIDADALFDDVEVKAEEGIEDELAE